jgi:hypothetical protein
MYPIGPFVIYASVNVIVGIEPVSLFHMELAARLSMVKSFGRGDEPSTSKSAYRMYFWDAWVTSVQSAFFIKNVNVLPKFVDIANVYEGASVGGKI